MLARLRKTEGEGGFTLIELLVVMIIIGILAAIAIPVFLSQRSKAQDSATKADASTVGKEVATWYVDNTAAPVITTQGTGDARRYGLGATAAAAATAENDIGKASSNVSYQGGTFATSTTWCIQFTNPNGSNGNTIWSYSAAAGLDNVVCTPAIAAPPA